MEKVYQLGSREGEILDDVHDLVWMIDLVESQSKRESSQRGNNHNASLMGFQKQFQLIPISLYDSEIPQQKHHSVS